MQFEGYAESDGDACDLLSMGGVCGLVESKHDKVLEPSRLHLLGAIGDAEGRPLRLKDFALPPIPLRTRPHKLVVCGSAMDVGKTHTVVSLNVGLRRQGCSVAAAKLTGTATGRDSWAMQDAGAHPVVDFVDGGFPSTYLCGLDELLALDRLLTAHAAALGAAWIVIEIADGLLQRDRGAPAFKRFARPWTLGLRLQRSPQRSAGSGCCGTGHQAPGLGSLSLSPLAMREPSDHRDPYLTAAQPQRGNLSGTCEHRLESPPFHERGAGALRSDVCSQGPAA
jgi:hypothetical protein